MVQRDGPWRGRRCGKRIRIVKRTRPGAARPLRRPDRRRRRGSGPPSTPRCSPSTPTSARAATRPTREVPPGGSRSGGGSADALSGPPRPPAQHHSAACAGCRAGRSGRRVFLRASAGAGPHSAATRSHRSGAAERAGPGRLRCRPSPRRTLVEDAVGPNHNRPSFRPPASGSQAPAHSPVAPPVWKMIPRAVIDRRAVRVSTLSALHSCLDIVTYLTQLITSWSN